MIKKLLVGIGFIAVLIAASIGGQIGKQVGKTVFSPAKPSEQEILSKLAQGFEAAAKQVNSAAPTMVDEETRMDRATVGPGALLTYHYTFPNYSSRDLDSGLINANVFPVVKKSVCASKEMKPSLQYGGQYAYSYSGNDGVLIGGFTIDRYDCGFTAFAP